MRKARRRLARTSGAALSRSLATTVAIGGIGGLLAAGDAGAQQVGGGTPGFDDPGGTIVLKGRERAVASAKKELIAALAESGQTVTGLATARGSAHAGTGASKRLDRALAKLESLTGVDVLAAAMAAVEQRAAQPVAARVEGWNVVSVVHEPQAKSYYCGPATAVMIIRQRGVTSRSGRNLSQAELAKPDMLNTDAHQATRWTSNVMASTLNWWTGRLLNPWPYTASGAPSAAELKMIAVYDIDIGYSFANETYEVGGSLRFNHHPSNRNIAHWTVTAGYNSSGDNLWVYDPAKSSAVSWSGPLDANFKISTAQFAGLMGSHGVVW